MTKEFFEKIYEAAETEAKNCGAEYCEVYYVGAESISANTFRDELAGFSADCDGSLIVRVSVGGKAGAAQGSLATPEEAALLVKKAAENAGLIEKEEEAVFCAGGQSYQEAVIPPFSMPSAAEVKDTAMALRHAAYASSPEISDGTEGGAYASRSEYYLYSSKGLRLSVSYGACGGGVYSVLERNGEKRDGYESAAKPFDELDAVGMAKTATERAAERFGAGLVDTGNYPVVLEGKQMQQILSAFIPVFFAKEAQQGTSLLAGKEGEKIAADFLSLIDDPFYPGNPMPLPFDGEGTPTYKKAVIEKGVLQTLLYNLESGKKAGKPSTGNGSRGASSIGTTYYNLYIEPGEKSREELFSMAEGGIFITGMKGFHAGANVVSGDFSIESEGFLIENGKKGRPVKSFTVSGNFFTLLKNVAALGNSIEDVLPAAHKIRCPDVLLLNVPIAGK